MERADLIAVVRETGCAQEYGGTFFLCDPGWSDAERAHVTRLHAEHAPRVSTSTDGERESGWLCMPTGGTSGSVRFARHDEHTIGAAVNGFCEFFRMERVNAIDVLPAYHISGFIARARCAATGGRHLAADWRQLEGGQRPALDEGAGPWVISLVPTQLQRLMTSPKATDWLRKFDTVFIGGGPVWIELARDAERWGLPIALTYGMTETAAMVAAISPGDFRAGERTWARPLPHAQLSLTSEGTICVGGASLFRGYYPERRESRVFTTDDLGQLDERGRLQVLGRRDAVIITGGKKVQPSEVEAALRATGEFEDVAVVGVASKEWGEEVVACYGHLETKTPDVSVVARALESSLTAFKRPKRYVAVPVWPRNAQGKLNRAALKTWIAGAEIGR